MLVDRVRASDHFADDELIPGLGQCMTEYENLDQPKPIEIADNKKMVAAAIVTIRGGIIHSGQPIPARILVLIIPGMGRHLLSSTKAMKSVVSTILETGNPRLQFDTTMSLFLNQH